MPGSDNALAPINLSPTGFKLSRFPTEEGPFNIEHRQLKNFLSSLKK
jgi:hypothetical protein